RFTSDRRDRAEDSIAEEQLDEISDFKQPESLFVELDKDQLMRTALGKLTARCQQVIGALFFEEPRPSYQEIASRLGLSGNSIGFTRERCLNNLKKILADLGYTP